MRVEKKRKTVRKVIEDFALELKNRKNDPHSRIKLLALEAIAQRMNWTETYNFIRYNEPETDPRGQDKRGLPWYFD